MKKLGVRNYTLISEAVKCDGSYDPNEIFPFFEESLYMDESDIIWDFLEWCHRDNKPFGRGNYEQVFKQFISLD